MSTVPPPATAVGPTGTPFAGFWVRLAAALLDALILLLPNYAITAAFLVTSDTGQVHVSLLGHLLLLILYLGYYGYFTGGKWQATPGKRIVGIYILRSDGSPIGYGRAIGRYLSQILSMLILCIGFIMIGFTREKTGLHDLIADTRVVYGKR